MQKAYDHSGEEDLYQAWEASGAMRADNQSTKPSFTIPLPPPNVTGQLHLGHAAMLAIEDILIRYKSMTGHEVLWIPGTDHAAIATENVVIKHHGKKSREDWPSREAFMEDARDFASQKHDTIVNQMKRMGAWLDWSREAYTFDEPRNQAVNETFKDLYEDGLIERGYRLINWSVGAQSVISDDELEWEDVQEPFYYIKCGKFIMGTVRPETKCANSPLVVHPEEAYVEIKAPDGQNYIVIKRLWDDPERFYKTLNFLSAEDGFEVVDTFVGTDLVGQEFEAETYGGTRKFQVIADRIIDPEKGSGAMTISASHSADDYELAKRLELDDMFFQKIDFEGKMSHLSGPCHGMTVEEARIESGAIMEAQGLLVGKDKGYKHRVPLCYRSGCVIEPMISPQWFVMVEKEFTDRHTGQTTTLKKLTQEAVREAQVDIIPERFEKIYFQWIDNLRDWCISRQIWWGHRIPVWYDEDGGIHLPEEQEIILVRHGESEGNRDGKVQGLEDRLTEKGRQHARDMVESLQSESVGIIVSGTSARNRETAQILSDELGVEVLEIPELSAYDTREVAGMTLDEIGRMAAIKYCRDNQKGEDFNTFTDRIALGLEKLKEVRSKGKIVFVTNRSIYSTLQALRSGSNLETVFERRSKNSHLPFGFIDRWKILQSPEGQNLTQDEDTLDTWFSSALWPFSTLEDPEDLAKFYPGDVLETGHDILFFWVARMIMFGRYKTGKYPFHTTYLHGMVTDEHGKKMSKSKGNGIDPLDAISESGADAVRLALVIGSTPGNQIPIGENKIKGYRNFVNKMWNAGRFMAMQCENAALDPKTLDLEALKPSTLSERWIASRFNATAKSVADNLDKFQISPAGDAIYHFVWGDFCDWYIEASKSNPNPAFSAALYAQILKLTHPLCPFVTEQIWSELFGRELLIQEAFPLSDFSDEAALKTFESIQDMVGQIRSLRAENKLNPKDKLQVQSVIEAQEIKNLIEILAGVQFMETVSASAHTLVNTHLEIAVEIPVDEGRKAAEIAGLEKQIAGLKGRLSNEAYIAKAPEALVAETRATLVEAEAKLSKLKK